MSSKYSAELFLEACGAGGPLHLSVDDSARPGPLRRVFHQPYVLIGRDPTTDLMLDNRRVSRRHAYLQLVNGRLFCVDLGSRTGTQWDDGAKVSGWLDPGRSIRVGPYEIARWPRDNGPEPETETPSKGSASDSTEGPAYKVEFLTPTARHSPIQVSQDLTLLGSSSDCRICLPHSDVSKAHCGLLRSASGLWIVDLLGRGGIFLNETHVRFARVDDCDELRIGRHILRLRIEGSPGWADPTPPSRSITRRAALDAPSTVLARTDRGGLPMPAPPLSSLPMAPTWHYPDGEVQRVLSDRPGGQAELIQALMQPMVQQFGLMQQQMFEQFHQAMMGMFQTFGSFYRDQMSDLRDELDEVRRLTQELQALQTESKLKESAPPSPAPVPKPAPKLAEKVIVPLKPTTVLKVPPKSDPGVHGLLFDRISQLQTERQTRWQKILGMLNRSKD